MCWTVYPVLVLDEMSSACACAKDRAIGKVWAQWNTGCKLAQLPGGIPLQKKLV
jgi:hypothetical protein